MRVSFVLPFANLSGGIRVCSVYAEYLRKRRHEVFVVSTPRRQPPLLQRIRNFVRGRKYETRSASHFDPLPIAHVRLPKFRPIVDSDLPDADVVVATWWETVTWVAGLSPRKGAKVHLIQHDETQFANQPTDRVEATWQLPLRRAVVAQWLKDLGQQRYNAPDITVIPNGVDTEAFHASPRGKQTRPTIGLMYSVAPFKATEVAVEAIRLAQKNVPQLCVKSFGLDLPGAALPLPEPGEFVHRPDPPVMRGIYASCDAWLFCSRSEGFGLPILEAMACRTPVIGTPAGAAPELLREGGGVLVKPQDPVDMAIAIERVMRMTDLEWRAMSDAANATAQKRTWDHSARLFEQWLLESIPISPAGTRGRVRPRPDEEVPSRPSD